jgi:hypothetical protein
VIVGVQLLWDLQWAVVVMIAALVVGDLNWVSR